MPDFVASLNLNAPPLKSYVTEFIIVEFHFDGLSEPLSKSSKNSNVSEPLLLLAAEPP
ncbi:Uncharacterised protein [uncultured archaeon]|nr:Uncharacterised protein [uncultured archaeon]